MTDKINELLRRVEEFKPKAAAEIEEFRIRILGKKGELTALMEEFKTVAPELKRELGQQLERINALVHQRAARAVAERRGRRGLVVGRPDAPRHGRAPRFAPPDLAGEKPDRRGLFAAGLHRGRRTRDRRRLARLLGPELPARTPRHATCRTRSSSRRTPTSCCARTPRRSRSARWSVRNRPSASSARAVCSATRPFRTARTASSTRSKDSTSTRASRSPT